ncbi:hypothetical protein TNCV_828731 [Trichonephila clavipes]|nr:hypothetical protein TNCV_828731 [Trichonephila clavipes]
MSSVSNIDLKANSNAKQGTRIVHPVLVKRVTKEKVVSSENRKQSVEQTEENILSTLPIDIRACSNVEDLSPSQKALKNTKVKTGYSKQQLSNKMIDITMLSKQDAEHLEGNGEIKTSSSATSMSDKQSSSASRATTKGSPMRLRKSNGNQLTALPVIPNNRTRMGVKCHLDMTTTPRLPLSLNFIKDFAKLYSFFTYKRQIKIRKDKLFLKK